MKIHVDKISSSTKNVPLKHAINISKRIISKDGNVIAVKVLEDKKIYNKLELITGRFSTIHVNDILIVTLGNRRALKGFSGEVPSTLKAGDIINILNLGGVAGICTSANLKEVGKPLKVEVLGAVINKKNEPINIRDYKLFPPSKKIKSNVPLIIVSGTCMNTGKTSVASEIIKKATREGYKVSGAKVAGIAALRDSMQMQDYGASKAVSMIDAGYVSTADASESSIRITKGAINYLSKDNPDYIVIELGDGIFGEYGVIDILEDTEFQKHMSAHIGCASDPLGAVKLFEVCQAIGTPLHVISGPVTDNSVGINFIRKNLKVQAINGLYQGDKLFTFLKASILKNATEQKNKPLYKTMKNIPKKSISIITIISLFILGGCFNFGSEEATSTTTTDANLSVYQTNDFGIDIPKEWEIIDQNDFTSEIPQETVVVIRNNVKNETFTANVNIVKRGLEQATDSTQYANLVGNRQKSGLVDYDEVKKEESGVTIGDQKTPSYFVVFNARKTTQDQLIRYWQTYAIKDNFAYIITGASSTNESESTSKIIENIVKSFRLR